jgi:histidinol phosphatase-like PHP family hydrolase
MNQNTLLNQHNIKYNPDILSKYTTFKNKRSQGYSIPQGECPQRIQITNTDGDMRKRMQVFNNERSVQNAQIQQIFSNQNRYRNKQIFDERQAEINKIMELMKKNPTSLEMKSESQKYNNQPRNTNLLDELKGLLINY